MPACRARAGAISFDHLRHADAEHPRAAIDDLLEIGLGIEVEPNRNAEAIAQWIGKKAGARRRHQRA